LLQRSAALGVAHQGKSGEEGQVEPVVEDEAGLYTAVGEEEAAVLLRQRVTVPGSRRHQMLSSGTRQPVQHEIETKNIKYQLVI